MTFEIYEKLNLWQMYYEKRIYDKRIMIFVTASRRVLNYDSKSLKKF